MLITIFWPSGNSGMTKLATSLQNLAQHNLFMAHDDRVFALSCGWQNFEQFWVRMIRLGKMNKKNLTLQKAVLQGLLAVKAWLSPQGTHPKHPLKMSENITHNCIQQTRAPIAFSNDNVSYYLGFWSHLALTFQVHGNPSLLWPVKEIQWCPWLLQPKLLFLAPLCTSWFYLFHPCLWLLQAIRGGHLAVPLLLSFVSHFVCRNRKTLNHCWDQQAHTTSWLQCSHSTILPPVFTQCHPGSSFHTAPPWLHCSLSAILVPVFTECHPGTTVHTVPPWHHCSHSAILAPVFTQHHPGSTVHTVPSWLQCSHSTILVPLFTQCHPGTSVHTVPSWCQCSQSAILAPLFTQCHPGSSVHTVPSWHHCSHSTILAPAFTQRQLTRCPRGCRAPSMSRWRGYPNIRVI